MDEGFLEPEEREQILCTVGHRSLSFDMAEQEIMQINEERRESNENDAKYQIGLGDADLIHLEDDEEEEEGFKFVMDTGVVSLIMKTDC